MPSEQLETQAGFQAALARLRQPLATAPPGHVREDIIGRTTDQQSFMLRADRIRLDEDQVRQQGKSVEDEETQQLAESIREHGLLQPIDVRWLEGAGTYEVVAGERRFVAAVQVLGWKEIPVRVLNATDDQLLWLQLHENLQRKDLHALDLADAIQAAMRQGLSLEEVAAKLCKSPTYVQKALTVAGKLTDEARAQLVGATKARGLEVAYEIATAPAEQQEKLARAAVEHRLTRSQVRTAAREAKRAHGHSTKRTGRPLNAGGYRRTYRLRNGASVTISFRKAKVATAEVIQALRETLVALEAERKRSSR